MADVVTVIQDNRVVVEVAGADAAAAIATAAVSEMAAQVASDLEEIQEIASGAPDAPSILNKLNKDGNNAEASLLANIGAVASADLADDTGSGLVGFLQSGTGAQAEDVQTALRRTVYAASYGVDSAASASTNTTGIQAAINEVGSRGGGEIILPPGVLLVNTVFLRSNVTLRGCGLGAFDTYAFTVRGTVLEQNDPDSPVVHVLSNVTWGTLRGVQLLDFQFKGHVSATARMLHFEALSPYAITESVVRVDSFGGFGLYEAVTGGGTNVYLCDFRMKANTCTDSPFVTFGAYNRYDLRANFVAANEYAVTVNDQSGNFRIVGDGPISVLGVANILEAAVETVHSAPTLAWEGAIALFGSRNTLVTPHVVNVDPARATASFRVFGSDCCIIGAQVFGSSVPAFPLDIGSISGVLTLVGGTINCVSQLQSYASATDLANVYSTGATESYYSPKAVGTTANRPGSLGTFDAARVYVDTTLDANGKPIFWNGSAWVPAIREGVNNYGDESFGLTVGSVNPTVRVLSALTADRTASLSLTNAQDGYTFRITRAASSTGAFNLNVGTGPLKALATGTWCDVTYDGSNGDWYLSGYGAL